MRNTGGAWGLVCALELLVVAACGSGAPSSATHTFGAGGAGGWGAGSTGHGGSGNNGSGGEITWFPGTGGGAGSGGSSACAGVTSKAEIVPLDIYLMLDSSGSMSETTGDSWTGPSKWTAITGALATFFADPQSSGMGVGLRHFPARPKGVPASCTANDQCPGETGPCLLKVCTGQVGASACTTDADCHTPSGKCVTLGECDGVLCAPANGGACQSNGQPCTPLTSSYCYNQDSCKASDYSVPDVEITPLNGAADALNSAIQAMGPEGATPTAAALQGAVDHAKAWGAANPNHQVVVLFATDGMPTLCTPQDISSIAQIAAAASADTPSIKTFVIGVFAPGDILAGAPTNLHKIAAAGGTQQAFIVDTSGNNVEGAFLAALAAVRNTGLACEYAMPSPQNGESLDPNKVNVEFTPSQGGTTVTIPYVEQAATCDPTLGGWYYDADPATGGTPTKLIMCPATCTTFKQDNAGQIDIRVGCKTIIPA